MPYFILVDGWVLNSSQILRVYPATNGGAYIDYVGGRQSWTQLSVQQIWEKINEQTPNRSSD